MAKATGHLSDDELGELGAHERIEAQRVREHLQTCAACRRRRADVIRLREVLAHTGLREGAPRHDVVPGVMMRLRLRRHGITNANELLEGFAALVRGLASLFSLPAMEQPRAGRRRSVEDEPHE